MMGLYAAIFDWTIVTFRLVPEEGSRAGKVLLYMAVTTIVRFGAWSGLIYGGIRLVKTAVEHGSF